MELALKPKKKKRIFELDYIRGICVWLMFFDHFMFDIGYVMPNLSIFSNYSNSCINGFVDFCRWYWNSTIRSDVRLVVLMCFFCICGISTNFSKSNIKRGLQLIFIGLLISEISILITYLGYNVEFFKQFKIGNIAVIFPIFLIYGISLFAYGMLKKMFNMCFKNTDGFKYVSLFLGIIFIVIPFIYNPNILNPNAYENMTYYKDELFFKMFIGLSCPFGQLDYWPLFPYIGLIFLGGSIGEAFYKNRESLIVKKDNKFTKKIARPVLFTGRHAFIFYIIQQIPIFIITFLIFAIVVYL